MIKKIFEKAQLKEHEPEELQSGPAGQLEPPK